jgi:hypothetical protein
MKFMESSKGGIQGVDALKNLEHHRAGRGTDRGRDELRTCGGVDVIPIAGRRPRVAREHVRKIFQRDGFGTVTAVRGNHHHRARETKFDNAYLSRGDWRDLTVAHHEYGRRSPTINERLPRWKGTTEIRSDITSGLIQTTGDKSGQKVGTNDIGGAKRNAGKQESE